MQSTERQKFEENWKSAFDGAEMTPSENVWNSIELDLAGQESAAMKKRVVFYQRVAAATVLFALLMGTYAFYTNYNRTENLQAVKNPVKNEVKNDVKSDVRKEDPTNSSATERTSNEKTSTDARTPAKTPAKTTVPPKENYIQQSVVGNEAPPAEIQTAAVVTEAPVVAEAPVVTEAPIAEQPVTETPAKQEVTSPILQTAPLVASLEPQDEPERKENKKNRGENTWLALGAAAGNYSPNSGSVASPQAQSSGAFAPTYSTLNNAANSDNKTKVGTSYSVGMAVGKKFGRFVVQSGINLNKQQVDYTSSYDTRSQMSNTTKASMADYSMAESADLTPTAAYTVNSSMEIVSIPVQAGYMIIDRKLGWQMNAGFSPDFFLRNTLVDKSGQRERFTQSAGNESPYRSVNWSGLVNTELSYKIGDHYRLSLVPGVRYSFNSLLKEPGDSGKPLILDVGFRFKYLFD